MLAFDIRRLRYFLKVAEAGSLTRAAELLHVAQPALSRHMRELENEFGIRLLVRSSRGVRVTDAGARLIREATDLLEFTRLLPDRVRQDDTSLEGRVSVALGQSIGTRFVSPLIATVAERMPAVRLEIREYMIAHLASAVRAGSVDLGLSYNIQEGGGLRAERLITEDIGLLGSPSLFDEYLGEPRPEQVSLEALALLPICLPPRSNRLRELVENAVRERNITVNVVAEIDSMHFLRAAAQSGIAFTVLPRSNLDSPEECGNASRRASIKNPRIELEIGLIMRSDRPLTRATRAVRDLIIELVRG